MSQKRFQRAFYTAALSVPARGGHTDKSRAKPYHIAQGKEKQRRQTRQPGPESQQDGHHKRHFFFFRHVFPPLGSTYTRPTH